MSGVALFLCPESDGRSREARLLDAAARFTGRDVSGWQRAAAPGGKPYFPAAPELEFSVSHSGDYWACAFGDAPLGLDLQKHQSCAFERLSRRFFHPEEDAWLRACAYAPEAFFRVWTAKESWLKLTGAGIAGGLEAFSVLSPLPGGAVLQYLSAPPGYTLCLCTGAPCAVRLLSAATGP